MKKDFLIVIGVLLIVIGVSFILHEKGIVTPKNNQKTIQNRSNQLPDTNSISKPHFPKVK